MARTALLLALALTTTAASASAANGPGDGATRPPRDGLNDRRIFDVMYQHQEEIDSCYAKELEKRPKLEATFFLEIRLSVSGSVLSAKLARTLAPQPTLEACVIDQVRKLVFPKPKDATDGFFTYPFSFHEPKTDRYGFLTDALLAKIGWIESTKRSLSSYPQCLKRCDVRREMESLCKAFGEASRRVDAGAVYAVAVEPILNATGAACCDDVVGVIRAVEHVADDDKYTLWCAMSEERVETDASVTIACGWAKCPAFEDFWPRLLRKPDSWFPRPEKGSK